jgi:hypothetical protein
MRVFSVFVLLSACSPSRPTIEAPPPDPGTRSRTYVRGDPAPAIERMRVNANKLGCKVEERSNGTFIACGDVELWIVPDPNGMEVTCTGLPVNCSKRGRELTREETPADAGTD